MTDAFAMFCGYICGWFSVVAAYKMLMPKQAEPAEPEPVVEPAPKTLEQMEQEKRDQQWLEQMSEMLRYDAKGGGKDGNKD
jgi:hypothetical protein